MIRLKNLLGLALLMTEMCQAQPVRQGKIVFSQLTAGGRSAILSANTDGSSSRVLLIQESKTLLDPSWAPGGGIYYVSADPNGQFSDLCWMSAEGKNSRVVRSFAGSVVFQPTPSPNGRYLLFYAAETNGGHERAQMWIAAADGSNARPFGPPDVAFPTWSFDSREVIAVENRNRLAAFDLKGNSLRSLFSVNGALLTPTCSPDGKRIVVCVAGADRTVGLVSLDRQGGDRRQYTQRSEVADLAPSFDEQGKLYFTRLTRKGCSLWSCDGQGQDQRKIAEEATTGAGVVRLWISSASQK